MEEYQQEDWPDCWVHTTESLLSGDICGYLRRFLMGVMASFQDVVNFHHCIVQRVDQILELKELQEQMKEAHIQLKTVKHVKK